MGSRLRTAGFAVLAAAGLVAMSGTATAAPAQAGTTARTMHSCATVTAGHAHCLAEMRTDVHRSNAAVRKAAATPSGYGPADLQSAYKLPSGSAGNGQTVAIVDAYDAPTAEQDLAVYRSQYGLPACTTANGCFRKVDQNGGTNYPRKNGGWAQEISLDLDMVSAVCPNCHILLVEAKSSSFANLGAAVNRAATMGADVISNSYGGSDASDANYGQYYNHPGIAITVSSGDAGYGVEYPASSHYVTAVGGTSLRADSSSRGWSESAWSGAGSGCSAYNTALSGQSGVGTGCGKRAVADVSAVADPNTGVAVYDSTAYQGYSGWMVFGGTSVAAPVIGAVYGLAGNAGSIDNNYPYAHASSLFDVTSGSNGSCSTSQWCRSRTGWDGPTGLGTPNGVGAF
ncbi:S53 family peptidase [Actinocatenispora sera]|uniref:Peptidase S8 n=1 Tax=Actinocatenispora sera TaxID=390989 RepID=A0A810LCM0_9ACTN|nr:S53 family peptidase [Actinocatenispora sera]BCJ31728.1 peptidase S8 [Actinocatenispora sera]